MKLVKIKRKIQYANSRFSLDWILAYLFLALGIAGLKSIPVKTGGTLKFSSETPTERTKDSYRLPSLSLHEAQAYTPSILCPLNGAHFISNADEREEVSLRWKKLPPHLTVEIEMKRLDDPEFRVSSKPTSKGIALSLPDGNYNWRVRTSNAHHEHSDWSPMYTFSIQENVRDAKPMTIQKEPLRSIDQ